MNAESSLRWPEEVNRALLAVKDALRQVAEVNSQVALARQLKATRPEIERQLQLAEEFYLARRKVLLDLEGPVSTLAGISDALLSLRERYETERLTLEGRLLLAEQADGGEVKAVCDELGSKLSQISDRCAMIAATVAAIKETLGEYSSEVSRQDLSLLGQQTVAPESLA